MPGIGFRSSAIDHQGHSHVPHDIAHRAADIRDDLDRQQQGQNTQGDTHGGADGSDTGNEGDLTGQAYRSHGNGQGYGYADGQGHGIKMDTEDMG